MRSVGTPRRYFVMAVDSFKFMPRTLAESMKVWPYVDTSGEEIPWTRSRKPVKESKVALVSSGGLYHKGDLPFDLDRERKEPLWGDPTFREIPRGISQEDVRAAHLHYETSHALEDYNCILPLAALEDMLTEGRIGSISDYQLSFMGYQPKLGTFARETAPRMAERLMELNVDLALVSSG
jgi:D-proline reductase (dithiol) PrdB